MSYNFLTQSVSTGGGEIYLDWVVNGFFTTACISLISFLMALILGTVIGVLTTKAEWIGKFARGFFALSRGVPLISQVFLFYFVIPYLLFGDFVRVFNPTAITYVTGTIALTLFMAGRIAGHFSTHFKALPEDQAASAYTLGFNHKQAMKLVLIPQAFRKALPMITSEAVNTVKNSAVLGTVGLFDLSKQATQLIEYTSQAIEAFTIIVIGYWIICAFVYLAMWYVGKRLA